MDIRLPNSVSFVLNRLEQKGFEAYIVGGCVRDSLLGKEPYDWDVCTDAKPDEIKDCFSDFTTVDTGIRFGTVTAVFPDMDIQITAYRTDSEYSDYRRPDRVSFTDSLKEDLSRRDFTINAMTYHPTKGLADFFGGLADLEKKTIRCVGDPSKRFTEDALRILRALRFSSVLSYFIEENTKKAAHQYKSLLLKISAERIVNEFNKLLLGDFVAEVLTEFSDIFDLLVPECKISERNDIPKSMISAPKDLVVRLALLFSDTKENPSESALFAKRTLQDLKYDKDTLQKTCFLVENASLRLENGLESVLKHFKRLSPSMYMKILDVKEARLKGLNAGCEQLKLIEDCRNTAYRILSGDYCWSVSSLKVNGNDLKEIGIEEGIRIGKTLDRLVDEVIEGRVKNKKEDLIRYVLDRVCQELP
jgi:tRNA nucleotidyltransferase (CCA-adding enzyme)